MITHRYALQIPPEHPALPGHFPGDPIVPGVLLLDEALHALDELGHGREGWQIESAKFHEPARPGEALALELDSGEDGLWRFRVLSCASSHLIASGALRR